MAKLVYGLSQSLDGYVDHLKLGPPALSAFRHFIELVGGLTGMIYGSRTYEIMRYWDEDLAEWDAEDRLFAAVWCSKPKWVMSRSLKSTGPNATLVADDAEVAIRRLKAELAGEISVGGPDLAHSLTEAGLIDEYRLPPPRAGWWQAILRRPATAAPPCGQRTNRRGPDSVGVRPCLARLQNSRCIVRLTESGIFLRKNAAR
jgi:dihydrofolate reductase